MFVAICEVWAQSCHQGIAKTNHSNLWCRWKPNQKQMKPIPNISRLGAWGRHLSQLGGHLLDSNLPPILGWLAWVTPIQWLNTGIDFDTLWWWLRLWPWLLFKAFLILMDPQWPRIGYPNDWDDLIQPNFINSTGTKEMQPKALRSRRFDRWCPCSFAAWEPGHK